MPKWISDARNYRGEDVMIAIVGNKLDDEENRLVATEEGMELAREQGVPEALFIETSAKMNLNIK